MPAEKMPETSKRRDGEEQAAAREDSPNDFHITINNSMIHNQQQNSLAQ